MSQKEGIKLNEKRIWTINQNIKRQKNAIQHETCTFPMTLRQRKNIFFSSTAQLKIGREYLHPARNSTGKHSVLE